MEESDSLQEDAVPSLPQNQGTSQLQPDLDPCPTAEANEELKCDVGLVFAKEDEDLANDIMDEMQTVEIAGSAIVVRLFNDVIFGGDIVDRPQVVCEHCTIVYIVHTENTTKDFTTNFTKNEAIAKIRIEKGGDNIRSLRTKEGLQSLPGLASMQPLDWYKPSKLKKLADIIKHERKQLKDNSISSKMGALTVQPGVNEQEEDCYAMKADPRGQCFIFNNKQFKKKEKRLGTDIDRDGLTKIFKELKFEVSVFNNKEADDMMTEIQNLSKEKHSQYDCVVLIFLTHGTDGRIYGSDDDSLRIEDITSFFKADRCPSLAYKPKIFFFASCRGTTSPKGVTFDGAGDGGQEITELVSPEAHFFIGYATVPGKKALRNEETGSWYIQALIKVLEESAHSKDFLSLMTDVKRVLHERQCESAEGDFLKQAAMSASSLLRKLYL